MTTMLLHLWLLAASAAAAPATSLTPPPLTPTVEGPAAPSPAPPPLPTLPGVPGSAAGSGAGAASGRARAPEANPVDGQKAATQKRDAKSDGSARLGGDKSTRTPSKRPAKPVLPTLTPTALKGELHQTLAKPGEAPVPVTDRRVSSSWHRRSRMRVRRSGRRRPAWRRLSNRSVRAARLAVRRAESTLLRLQQQRQPKRRLASNWTACPRL